MWSTSRPKTWLVMYTQKAIIYSFCNAIDFCSVDKCYDVLDQCQQNDSCRNLLNTINRKCSDVLYSNITRFTTCPDHCKQSLYKLYKHPIGYKLKCCDCGMVEHHQDVSVIQCFTQHSNVMNYCDINDDDCVDCKVRGKLYMSIFGAYACL